MHRVVILIAIVMTALSIGAARAMDETASCPDALVEPPEKQINVWRYHGHADFTAATHLNLVRRPGSPHYHADLMGIAHDQDDYAMVGRFRRRAYDETYRFLANPIRAEFQTERKGDTIFERIQYYSLKLMEKVTYLKGNQSDEKVKESYSLHPDSVTIFESTVRRTKTELMGEYGEIPETARPDSNASAFSAYMSHFDLDLLPPIGFDESDMEREQTNAGEVKKGTPTATWESDPFYEEKIGASWLIAGQGPKGKFTLPLQTDNLAKAIDRDEHPFIWEVGRAGQTKDSGFDETLKMAAFLAFYELLVLGGDLNQAYIFSHSLDLSHTRVYVGKYRMRVFSPYEGSDTELALIAPLKKLLDRHNLESFSPSAADLVEAAGNNPTFGGVKALPFVIRAREMRDMVLQSADGGGESVVHVRDFSNIQYPLFQNLARQLDISDERREAVTEHLWNYRPSHVLRDSIGDHLQRSQGHQYAPIRGIIGDDGGRHGDRNGLQTLRHFLYGHNAIELWAHDGSTHHPAQELAAAYLFFADRLRQAGIDSPEDHMAKNYLRFCYTSQEGDGAERLAAFGPDDRWFVHQDEHVSFRSFAVGGLAGFGGFPEVVIPRVHYDSYCFRATAIAEWLKAAENDPGSASPPRLILGNRHTDELLSNPQMFAPSY